MRSFVQTEVVEEISKEPNQHGLANQELTDTWMDFRVGGRRTKFFSITCLVANYKHYVVSYKEKSYIEPKQNCEPPPTKKEIRI